MSIPSRSQHDPAPSALQLWGGVECTVNRVADAYFTQLDRSGHVDREDDLDRFAALGIRAIRYPVLWERTAPDGLDSADWHFADQRLPALRRLGISPIVGLVHHGSGPQHTHLLDPGFATGLAEFAGAVAARFPWVEHWTPVNEPLTTARFSALYGVWYPHASDDGSFVRALLNESRATVLSMQAIRRVNPDAKLIQTDDLGRSYGTETMAQTVDFYNQRRWLGWDLLCGRVDRTHPLWGYLVGSGADENELLWFLDNRCPPDIIGINYYVTSDRWIDHRFDRFPAEGRGRAGFVDIESVRVLANHAPGVGPLLAEAWERYGIPLAITEAHIDATREDQLRWFLEIWRAAEGARKAGADIRGVTAWSLLGAFDWNCLSTACRGYYEPGPYDIRAPLPRPTALASLMQELAAGRAPSHPVLQGEGWWRRPERFIARPVATRALVTQLAGHRAPLAPERMTPILISGATGTLGQAFATVCRQRNLAFRLLERGDMDIADPASVEAALARWKPWAVVNTSGYVRIDDAESDSERCLRENASGPAVLAAACAKSGVALVTFSSDQVFDGRGERPWVESDLPAPLNCYGRSKAAAEAAVLAAHPGAMVVRTSAFFGPWDRHNFLVHALDALAAGREFRAADDVRISPTYVPDLVNVCLDLLVDRESGIWHLANHGDVSWAQFAAEAALLAQVDASTLRPCASAELGEVAARPRYGVLRSERASLMPTLENAMARFLAERRARAAVPQREARASGA
jgi:dTDP-4-dehydrorhamnose reductase